MIKSKLKSILPALVSTLVILAAGFSGFASAQNASISNTGPDSDNSITFSNSSVCDITNNNSLSLSNNVNQNASSGNVSVDHNTGGYPSNWGEWDPAVWASHGYSYDEWHGQFMAHMSAEAGNLKANWGSLSSGGNATSGNASNNSSSVTAISINNGKNGCGSGMAHMNPPVNQPGTKAPQGTVVLGASAVASQGVGGSGSGSGSQSPAHKSSGNSTPASSSSQNNTNQPSYPGHSVGHPDHADQTASISNTGPDSDNSITFSNTSNTTVTNNNVISVATTNYQTANSGDATVNNNTSAGGAATGDSSNDASSTISVTISN